MLITGLFVLGFWIFAWGLCGVFNKGPFTKNEERPAVIEGNPAATIIVTVRTPRYLSVVCILAGGVGLSVMALLNYRLLASPLGAVVGQDWTWYAVWILPAIIMLVILLLSIFQPSPVDENSRANYIDAMKTLITAAGLTVGFVTANLKPNTLSQVWIDALKVSTISLVGCVVCAVTTLFAISILYDYSRAKSRTVHWSLLLFFALPEAYFAVAFFFRGFINLIRLTSLL